MQRKLCALRNRTALYTSEKRKQKQGNKKKISEWESVAPALNYGRTSTNASLCNYDECQHAPDRPTTLHRRRETTDHAAFRGNFAAKTGKPMNLVASSLVRISHRQPNHRDDGNHLSQELPCGVFKMSQKGRNVAENKTDWGWKERKGRRRKEESDSFFPRDDKPSGWAICKVD